MSETWPEIADRRYRDAVVTVADRLRDMADRVEREGLRIAGPGRSYGKAASSAIHELTWGVANANVERLVSDAADADEALLGGAS